MTLKEAFKQLAESVEYKDIAKQNNGIGGKYRTYKARYDNDELKAGAMVEILIANGYEIKANKAVKKK